MEKDSLEVTCVCVCMCVSARACGVGGQVYPRERTVLIQFDVKPSGLESF